MYNRDNCLKHIQRIEGIYSSVLSLMDVELYLKHSDELEQSFEYLYSENFIVYLSEKEDVELFKLLEEVYKQHTRVEELFQGQMELLMEKMRVNSSVARLSAYSSSPVLDAAFFDEKR